MKTKGATKRAAAILLTVLATSLAALLVFNLSLGDQHIDEPLEHTYSGYDAQFTYAMGELLGTGFAKGNQAHAPLNGEENFPVMLETIRTAQHTVTLELYIFYTGKPSVSLPMY